MSKVVKLTGEVPMFNHQESIAVIGRAVNYNAEILDKLIERVDELEQTIKKMKEAGNGN